MEERTILEMLKYRKLNCEEALEYLAAAEQDPIIVYDRKKGWAILLDESGEVKAKLKRKTEELIISLTIGKDLWKRSIHEALTYVLEKNKSNNSRQ